MLTVPLIEKFLLVMLTAKCELLFSVQEFLKAKQILLIKRNLQRKGIFLIDKNPYRLDKNTMLWIYPRRGKNEDITREQKTYHERRTTTEHIAPL